MVEARRPDTQKPQHREQAGSDKRYGKRDWSVDHGITMRFSVAGIADSGRNRRKDRRHDSHTRGPPNVGKLPGPS